MGTEAGVSTATATNIPSSNLGLLDIMYGEITRLAVATEPRLDGSVFISEEFSAGCLLVGELLLVPISEILQSNLASGLVDTTRVGMITRVTS